MYVHAHVCSLKQILKRKEMGWVIFLTLVGKWSSLPVDPDLPLSPSPSSTPFSQSHKGRRSAPQTLTDIKSPANLAKVPRYVRGRAHDSASLTSSQVCRCCRPTDGQGGHMVMNHSDTLRLRASAHPAPEEPRSAPSTSVSHPHPRISSLTTH